MKSYSFKKKSVEEKISEPAWRNTILVLMKNFPGDVNKTETKEDIKGIDLTYEFDDRHIADLRIQCKTNNVDYHHFYQKYKTHIIETMGNVELNDLGSALINCHADVVGSGWHDPKTNSILDPIFFSPQPVAQRVAKGIDDGKIKEKLTSTKNEKTGEILYHTRFAIVNSTQYIHPDIFDPDVVYGNKPVIINSTSGTMEEFF